MGKKSLEPIKVPCPERWLERDGIPCQLEDAHTGMHYHKGPVKLGNRTIVIELWWNFGKYFGQAICDAERK